MFTVGGAVEFWHTGSSEMQYDALELYVYGIFTWTLVLEFQVL